MAGNVVTYGGGGAQSDGYWKDWQKRGMLTGKPSYQPSGYSMWGPTSGPTSGWSQQPGQATQGAIAPQKPKTEGLLTKPGEQEQMWADTKGWFTGPTNAQALYDSGNQGLNKWFDRARDQGNASLRRQMAATGMFGSSDMARGMFELEGKLGAEQARDMAGLARDADAAELARKGTGLAYAGQVQDRFTDRVRMPLEDKFKLADRYSGLVSQMAGKSTDEQAAIKESIIQSIIAEGKMDYDAASQAVEEMLGMAGVGISAFDAGQSNRKQSGSGGRSGTPVWSDEQGGYVYP